MNIFVLDKNQTLCAHYHNDRHCVKMVLESTQLLSNAHWETGMEGPYKQTHKNHPCSLWASESITNYEWLLMLALELSNEYSYRYKKTHACLKKIEWLIDNYPDLPDRGLTPFAQAMPEQYRNKDAVQAYRGYYIGEKQHIAQWKMRDVPYWWRGN
jgi:hypothetical protein